MMKKLLCIGMALIFVFFVVPAMAADVCPFKSALPEAETSVVQMTNTELSEVRGGRVWTFKNTFISRPAPTPPTNPTVQITTPSSSGNNQVNNFDLSNPVGGSLTYTQTTSTPNGYQKLFVSWPDLDVTTVP